MKCSLDTSILARGSQINIRNYQLFVGTYLAVELVGTYLAVEL